MNACHEGSDIDLFVITRKNRLWIARIWLTLLTSLLWVRKNSRKHAWKFCLSFFISEDEEHFSDIAIKDDIYLSYWLETVTPVVNKNNAFEKFLERNALENIRNKLISESPLFTREEGYTLNYLYPKSFLFQKEKGAANSFVASLSWKEREQDELQSKREYPGVFKNEFVFVWSKIINKIIKQIWDFNEYILKKIFLWKTLKNYEKLWKPFGVIISNTMLKFHDKDKRKEIRDAVL